MLRSLGITPAVAVQTGRSSEMMAGAVRASRDTTYTTQTSDRLVELTLHPQW
jgi:hypothetical protein